MLYYDEIFEIMEKKSINHKSPCIVFSLALDKDDFTRRLICHYSKIKLQKVESGNLEADEMAAFKKCACRISDSPIYIDDSKNLNVTDIIAKINSLDMGIKLLIVDCLYLVDSNDTEKNRAPTEEDIAKDFKKYAHDFGVHVLLTTSTGAIISFGAN